MKLPEKIFARRHEIAADYLKELDKHLDDIVSGRTTEMLEVRDLADLIHVHPVHLSNTVKAATGYSPCYFFEKRLMEISKSMLVSTNTPISEIARILTYDPSNFTKFFKHFAGQTPKQYREAYYISIANKDLITA
ncbi:helix-turn-helix domain-containing protein [Pedobacter petrophilus]|uniref:Helix-turn-helix domain-containing protein n=1 Tax=Pedobacter petrophilus TaxID=1908241 RepID=A0A7K0G361_9SPHI|nr:AraC family transcriptional regulator [Pedobacter petrophilus]MRX78253.1 helix-turn-helix domain-containing protein [Pedobacter petrophilus]